MPGPTNFGAGSDGHIPDQSTVKGIDRTTSKEQNLSRSAKAEIKRVAKEKKEATAAAAVEAAAVEAPTADLLDFGDFEAAPTLPPPSAP